MLFGDGRVVGEGLRGARRRRLTLCDGEMGESGDTALEEGVRMLPSDEGRHADEEVEVAGDVVVDQALKQVLEAEAAQRANMQMET